jgi:hypothetical protein
LQLSVSPPTEPAEAWPVDQENDQENDRVNVLAKVAHRVLGAEPVVLQAEVRV